MNEFVPTIAVNPLRTCAAKLDAGGREKLQEAVSKVVGEVFIGTLLREFRAGLKSDNPLSGGKVGAIYTSRLDQELLTRLAASKRFAVGTEVAKRWMGLEGSTEK